MFLFEFSKRFKIYNTSNKPTQSFNSFNQIEAPLHCNFSNPHDQAALRCSYPSDLHVWYDVPSPSRFHLILCYICICTIWCSHKICIIVESCDNIFHTVSPNSPISFEWPEKKIPNPTLYWWSCDAPPTTMVLFCVLVIAQPNSCIHTATEREQTCWIYTL
jgi:hypothetical protein